MKEVTDYIVARGTNEITLAGAVYKLIEGGWQPQGGISILHTGPEAAFFQAMIKYEE